MRAEPVAFLVPLDSRHLLLLTSEPAPNAANARHSFSEHLPNRLQQLFVIELTLHDVGVGAQG